MKYFRQFHGKGSIQDVVQNGKCYTFDLEMNNSIFILTKYDEYRISESGNPSSYAYHGLDFKNYRTDHLPFRESSVEEIEQLLKFREEQRIELPAPLNFEKHYDIF